MAKVASEFPLVQPHLYATQIPPVVYLPGTLMFIGGLAIVRAHHHWATDWTVLVMTLKAYGRQGSSAGGATGAGRTTGTPPGPRS